MKKIWIYTILAVIITFSVSAYLFTSDSGELTPKVSHHKSSNDIMLSADEFRALYNTEKGMLIDVRTAGEVESGKIPEAVNIDFYSKDFSKEVAVLNKKESIFLYGAIHSRSEKALEVIKELGFENIYVLKEGIRGWEVAGYPIEKESIGSGSKFL